MGHPPERSICHQNVLPLMDWLFVNSLVVSDRTNALPLVLQYVLCISIPSMKCTLNRRLT